MPGISDDAKHHDAHTRVVDQAQRTLKELEMLLDYHEELLAAFRKKLEPTKRKKR